MLGESPPLSYMWGIGIHNGYLSDRKVGHQILAAASSTQSDVSTLEVCRDCRLTKAGEYENTQMEH